MAASKTRFDADWVRASNMVAEVDAATRTPAGCVRFYLKFVVIGGLAGRRPETLRAKWHWLRRQAGKSNRNRAGGRELSVERLVFNLTNEPSPT